MKRGFMKYGFVKKVTAASLAAAMSLTLSPVFAMVDLPEGSISSDYVYQWQDNENGTVGNEVSSWTHGKYVEDATYGKVASLGGITNRFWDHNCGGLEENAVVSFSVMPRTNQNYVFPLRMKADTGQENYWSLASVLFSQDGKIKISDQSRARVGVDTPDKALNGAFVELTHWDGSKGIDHYLDTNMTYELNKWYNIDYVITGMGQEGYKQVVQVYVNGELAGVVKADCLNGMTDEHKDKFKSTAGLGTFHPGPVGVVAGDDTEQVTYTEKKDNKEVENTYTSIKDDKRFLFDNWRVIKLGDSSTKFYAQVDSSKAMTEGEITVEYTETPLKADETEATKLYSPTGKEITLTTSVENGRFATYKFAPAEFTEDGEYTLVLPSRESVTGRTLANNAVVFEKREVDITDDEVVYSTLHDFEDWTEDTAEHTERQIKRNPITDGGAQKTYLKGLQGFQGQNNEADYVHIPAKLVSGKNSGKALQWNYTDNWMGTTNKDAKSYSNGEYVDIKNGNGEIVGARPLSLTWIKKDVGFESPVLEGKDHEYIVSYDLQAPKPGAVSVGTTVQTNKCGVGYVIIDKYNNLVMSMNLTDIKGNASTTPSYYWQGVVDENGNYFSEKPGGYIDVTDSGFNAWKDHYVVNKLTEGQWYNIKVGFVPATKTVNYYLDNRLVGSYVHSSLDDTTYISMLDIRANDYGPSNTTSITTIDNLGFGVRAGADYTKGKDNVAKLTKTPTEENTNNFEQIKISDIVSSDNTDFDEGAWLLSTDLTLNDINPTYSIRLYNKYDIETGLLSMTLKDTNGTLVFDKSSSNGGHKNRDFTSSGGDASSVKIAKDKKINLTVYMDSNRENITAYVNGKKAVTYPVSGLQGVNVFRTIKDHISSREDGKYAFLDANYDEKVSGGELTPGYIKVFSLGSNVENREVKAENTVLYKISNNSEKKILENIRVYGNDEEYTLFNSDNYVDKIELNYRNNLSAAPVVCLKAEGSETELANATVEKDGKKAIITLADNRKALADGRYTLTVDGKDYNFNINTGKKFAVDTPLSISVNGENATANTKITSFTDDCKITVMLAEYNTDGTLKNIKYVAKTLNVGDTFDTQDAANKVEITNASSASTFRAYIWSDFATMIPYASAAKN